MKVNGAETTLDSTDFNCVDKKKAHIIQNFFFCVPLIKEIQTGLQ